MVTELALRPYRRNTLGEGAGGQEGRRAGGQEGRRTGGQEGRRAGGQESVVYVLEELVRIRE